MRWRLFSVLGVLFLLSASVIFLGPAPALLPKAHAASISITLSGCVVPTGTCTSAGWWEGGIKDPTITVNQGDTVTLRLSSADRNVHQFIVDVDGTGNCSTTDPCSSMFSTGTTLTFVANMASGTYSYACTIHPQMLVAGGFRVNPAPPDFSFSASPSTVSTNLEIIGNSTITVAPQSGFTGTVSLAVTTNSTNLSCALSPTTISGGSGSSLLSCASNFPAKYLATVTGTSGSLSHSTDVVYNTTTSGTVNGVLHSVNIAALLTPYIVLGIASASLLLAVLTYTLRRRSKPEDSLSAV
jgi:hypothetical protein